MSRCSRDGGEPVVSVMMVTYGAGELVERALAALDRHTEVPYELIVVDNGSDSRTREQLRQITNARVVLNARNRGFGAANNQAAALARAPHLVLLNSDAFVESGWLEPLLTAMDDTAVGAAVPCLLNEDRTLQDAGPLLARDGTVALYGDGDDPDRYVYRFRRTLDFGSAACMLIRRELFTSLGGFDECFSPAYYEDADLCLRMAGAGKRTVYEPRSRVVHVRYGSSSANIAPDLSERNRRVFARRWAHALLGRPATLRVPTPSAQIAARDARATPRILLLAGGAAAEAVALSLRHRWPGARVTWGLHGDAPEEPESLLAAGVELLPEPPEEWLDTRPLHYDLVIADGPESPYAAAVRRTQPQAVHLRYDEASEADRSGDPAGSHAPEKRLHRRFATAGIAPPRGTIKTIR